MSQSEVMRGQVLKISSVICSMFYLILFYLYGRGKSSYLSILSAQTCDRWEIGQLLFLTGTQLNLVATVKKATQRKFVYYMSLRCDHMPAFYCISCLRGRKKKIEHVKHRLSKYLHFPFSAKDVSDTHDTHSYLSDHALQLCLLMGILMTILLIKWTFTIGCWLNPYFVMTEKEWTENGKRAEET